MNTSQIFENFCFDKVSDYLDSLNEDFVRKHLVNNTRLERAWVNWASDFEAILMFDLLVEICEETNHDGEGTVTEEDLSTFHEFIWEAIDEKLHPSFDLIHRICNNLTSEDFLEPK
jgi:hypothetical protein